MVAKYPGLFKASSIVNSRRKLRRILDVDSEINFDRLDEVQKAKIDLIVNDKYSPAEQKKLYDICLNYGARVNHPSQKHNQYARARQFVYRTVDDMGFKIEKEDRKIQAFRLEKRAQSYGIIKPMYAQFTAATKTLLSTADSRTRWPTDKRMKTRPRGRANQLLFSTACIRELPASQKSWAKPRRACRSCRASTPPRSSPS